MDRSLKKLNLIRQKRTQRVRKRLRGTKPRLHVLKTNQHIHVQLIDDVQEKTIASTSTVAKEFKGCRKNKASATKLGEKIAQLALEKDVKDVVFDRGGHKFHGILAAVAEGARANGLNF